MRTDAHISRRQFCALSVSIPLVGCSSLRQNAPEDQSAQQPSEIYHSDRFSTLVDSILPPGNDYPAGSSAGVALYLDRFLGELRVDTPQAAEARCRQYEALLQGLETLGFYQPSANRAALREAVEQGQHGDELKKFLVVTKEDCISAYFSDPVIWRKGKAPEIWQRLGIDPIFPLDVRADVAKRGMRGAANDELLRLLRQPRDRLPVAFRDEDPKRLVRDIYSAPSLVY